MFDSFKQLNQLRQLQNAIQKEEITVERDGFSITINGSFEIRNVSIADGIDSSKLEKLIKDCHAEAMKKMQSIVASKFSALQNQ